ncbi:NACHT domain-containing protein [Streptomyces lasiicapitis]|uniref:NACHT domain-containing protein n=1 Tax=Streptomyces lasiicapitis TaxID=1923961 RepID=A0ABQ2MKS0_9ACTN|nr:NACHT domain-containing protein [Streptomyces lasiicapitis]GGO53658.1 hypothetical protein GCM10012286_61570 [Streptomyces lasiicapitis]
MKRSRTRRVAVTYAALQIATAALALWLTKQFQVARMSATLIALAPTLPGAYLTWAAYHNDRREAAADTDAKATMLAAAVAPAETRQRAQLIGPGAHRIDVAFHYRTEPANNATGAAPEGRLTNVVAYYRNLRPARLVITGEPGGGKTLLALDLLLGLLTHNARTAADPVPVRLSVAGWDTDRPLPEWLADQIHQQFRDRGLTAADAGMLVDQHRILPVLDGLDEMDTDTTPAARRRAVAALQQLNAYQHPTGSAPVILTCRTTQYEQLAALDMRMREAAHIQIAPVPPAQAAAYLTARSTRPTRWSPVIDTLNTAPGGALAKALSTPWRLNLAATAYEERHPDTLGYLRDPADLLTLPSPHAVRDHLLALYLPAATSQHPTRPGRYPPHQTHRWLAALATHLATTDPASPGSGTDLVLHQLWPMAGAHRVRTTDALLICPLALAFPALYLATTPVDFSLRMFLGTALTAWPLAAVWQASRATVRTPHTVHLHRLRSPTHLRRLARDLGFGLTLGLALGLVVELVAGLVIAVAVGLALWLKDVLTEPLSCDAAPTDPRYPVRDDLAVGLASVLAVGLAIGLLSGLANGLTVGLAIGSMGLIVGVPLGLYVFSGAGRRYVVLLCCSRGRLPWRLGAFLHWAYEAGLLRISGMAYQFRHRELQDWLAAQARLR